MRRQGIAVVLSAVEVAMDWLRQTVHGVEPELIEFAFACEAIR